MCVHCFLGVVPGCSNDQKPNSISAGNDIGSYHTSIARKFASNKIYCSSQKIDNERNFAVLTDISIPALENYRIYITLDGDFNLAV